jgi:hypothetical protein
MANSSDYTITTLSESVQQRGFKAGVDGTQAPFLFGGPLGPPNLRGRDTAYVSAEGNPVAPRPPQLPFSINLSRIDVPATAYSASAENEISYIEPFAYYDFETSGSQYVTNVLGANNYTGSFEGSGQKFESSDVFSGSYSMSFPNSADSRITLGTPAERNAWNTLFSGSFSISMWVKPKHTSNTNNFLSTLFSLQDNSTNGPGTFGFSFLLGRNTAFGAPVVRSSPSNGGGGGWSGTSTFSDGTGSYPYTANAWNHFVFVVEGGQSDDNRFVKAYINNNYVGFASPDGTTARDFQYNWRQTDTVTFGTTYTSTNETFVNMDEISIWNIDLSAGQVNALYNNGTGSYALTALTSSG